MSSDLVEGTRICLKLLDGRLWRDRDFVPVPSRQPDVPVVAPCARFEELHIDFLAFTALLTFAPPDLVVVFDGDFFLLFLGLLRASVIFAGRDGVFF